MAFIVQKFGGTSVADPAARELMLRKVVAARSRGDRVAVVVSAMGRKGAPYATDTLLGLLDEAGGSADGAIRDLLASCGETISACLVASLLSARGAKAVALSAYTAGIRAEGPYGDADITAVDASRILAAIDSGAVPVITGFQAVDGGGSIVTIGRGGSDTSAVAIGAYAKADFVDIFTDVPGVAVVDPRLVPEAPFIPYLDYRSMYRLAANGARVLHDRSALMGERFGARIRVRSTFDDGEGTLIGPEALPSGSGPALGIAVSKAGERAVVTVVCQAGKAASIAAIASEAAATAGGKLEPGDDPDALAFSCQATGSSALVRSLYDAVAQYF